MIHKTAIINKKAKINSDVENNSKVMGYPAKSLREFIKDNRWYTKLQLLTKEQKYMKKLK